MRWKSDKPRPDTYWKPWFAWHPVKIEDTGENVWLERIWRNVTMVDRGLFGRVAVRRYRSDIHWAGANLMHFPDRR